MGDVTNFSVLKAPLALCGAMLAVALLAVALTGIDPSALFLPYVRSAAAVTLLCTVLWLITLFVGLALRREQRPAAPIVAALRDRAPLLLLPALVFPLFLAGFTTAKTAIPFLVGYQWEGFWASADRLVFRDDAWRIAHAWIGADGAAVLAWFYTIGWGAVLVAGSAFVPLFASKRFTGTFFTAMFGTWLIGGCFVAYLFSAAGPVFAHLADPALAEGFRPMRAALAETLDPLSLITTTQAYLEGAVHSTVAVKGGGISAMPSMHIGAASIYVLAARGTRWLVPALLFWAIIFIGSAYFGYHYWLDGVVAAAVAWGCWKVAEALHAEGAATAFPRIAGAAVKPPLAA